MKKRIALFLAAAMAAMCAQADTWADPDTGYTWTYQINGDAAEIYNSGSAAISPSPTGAVTIPSTLGGKPVTSIGASAFYNCSGLTSVTIPDGVMGIGYGAFYNCSGLTSVAIPASVTSVGSPKGCNVDGNGNISVYGGVFNRCGSLTNIIVDAANKYYKSVQGLLLSKDGKTLVQGVNGDVSIPTSVTRIDLGAFAGCVGLVSVIMPNSVTSIGDAAFVDCMCFTNVVIPNSVTSIGRYAFLRSGLKNMAIPQCACTSRDAWEELFGLMYVIDGAGNMTMIGGGNIKNVERLVIQDGVTSIGNNTFSSCSGLTSVTIPDSVMNIEDGAFEACEGLKSVTFLGNAPRLGENVFASVDPDCVAYVGTDSTGWGVDIPGTWNGMRITYIEQSPIEQSPDPDPDPEPEPEPQQVWTGFAKAQTVLGALYGRDGVPVGTVQVKVGKVSKKGVVKISASATLLVDGKAKKVSAKAVSIVLDATGRVPPVTLAFKAPIGDMAFEMAADGTFTLKNGSYVMAEKSVGGNWTRTDARVWVDGGRGATALPAGTVEELLPAGEPVIPKAGKWSFAKAATVKWAKPKKGAERPEIFDEASGKGLIVDDAKGKTNLSGLKLTYTPKTGIFKGSFKIYAIQGGKLKKIVVKVIGEVVDGKGWGSATGPGGVSFAVTVE